GVVYIHTCECSVAALSRPLYKDSRLPQQGSAHVREVPLPLRLRRDAAGRTRQYGAGSGGVQGSGGQGMARKLVIIMANTDPRNGEELGAPIFQASVAAAMDYEVEVICTATAGRLMKKGVAETLVVKPGSPKSV